MSARVLAEFVLPASAVAVSVRRPTGREEMLLAEGGLSVDELALALAERLASGLKAVDWRAVPAPDIDALLLLIRRALIGDRIISDIPCPAPQCGARIDISFSIEAYLAHHRPERAPLRRRYWSVESSAERPAWYRLALRGTTDLLAFRLPTIGDQLAATGDEEGAGAIASGCLDPPAMSPRARRVAELAMQSLAPDLTDDLQGSCPECGATVTALFEPRRYCLSEMRDHARFIYEDVNSLAQRYGWSESAILSLPSARRTHYAELARAARAA